MCGSRELLRINENSCARFTSNIISAIKQVIDTNQGGRKGERGRPTEGREGNTQPILERLDLPEAHTRLRLALVTACLDSLCCACLAQLVSCVHTRTKVTSAYRSLSLSLPTKSVFLVANQCYKTRCKAVSIGTSFNLGALLLCW